MADTIKTLSDRALETLQRELTSLRNQIHTFRSTAKTQSDTLWPTRHVVKTDADGITARSGDTPGKGDVVVQRVGGDGNGNLGDLVATTQTFTVYNMAPLPIAGDIYIDIWRDARGVWFAEYPRDISSQAKADGAITAGSSGTVSLYLDGVDSTDNVTAHLSWAEGGDDVTSGDEIFVWYDANSEKWMITGGECP